MMQNYITVDVIVGVTFRRILRLVPAEYGRQRALLAVKVSYIGKVAALLE
jgi:hypothetical protein